MDDKYKQEHELFVQNLTGSSIFETCLILNIVPISILFQRVLFATFFDKRTLSTLPLFIRAPLEFLTILLPFIVSVTSIELLPYLLILMIVSFLIIPIFSKPNSAPVFNFKENKEILAQLNAPRKRFIEEYRAFVMLATIVCILAVDFPVFPRRLSKTETFGISLMDIGVGSVVLSGAMVSRQARSEQASSKEKVEPKKKSDSSSSSSLSGEPKLTRLSLAYRALLSNLPLLILGFVRMILTKSTNYQEHVTEYGIHWNFFFTLGFVSIFLSLLKLSPNMGLAVGSLLIIGYQVLLSQFSLSEYILDAPRLNLISANKEGICSLAGYLSIYLIGIKLGTTIFKNRPTLAEWKSYALKLIALSLVLFGVLYVVEQEIQPISRRMTNLGYVLAILALNIFNFAVVLLVAIFSADQTPSSITSAINRNQLFMFLLANIMTGLINFSMKTIYADYQTSMAVIIGYVSVVTIVGIILDKKNIVLKLG